MWNQKDNLIQFRTLAHLHQKGKLDKILLIIAIISIFTTTYIADFLNYKYNIEPWRFSLNLYRFSYLILFISVREKIKKLIGTIGYRIIVYLLMNHFVDRYFGYTTWSWNDAITLSTIEIDTLVTYFKNKKKDDRG
jgi:hypothetical protein